MYVGETSTKLHERFTEHRSNIQTGKTGPILMKSAQIWTFLQLPHLNMSKGKYQTHSWAFSIELISLPSCKGNNTVSKYKKKTIAPFGLNKRREIPPPIPFVLQFSDQAADIKKLVKTFYEKFRLQRFGTFLRYQFVSPYKTNKNLKDMLISAS